MKRKAWLVAGVRRTVHDQRSVVCSSLPAICPRDPILTKTPSDASCIASTVALRAPVHRSYATSSMQQRTQSAALEDSEEHAQAKMRRKLVRCLYSAVLHLTRDFEKNVHPRKQPWLEIDSLLSAFGTEVPTEQGLMHCAREVFAAKKNETNPEEIERLINEGFAVLKQLSTSYADISPWATLFKNKMDRDFIDREVPPEEALVTLSHLAGRKVNLEEIKAELDKIADLVRKKLAQKTNDGIEPRSTGTDIRVTDDNEWKLNPWEEQVMRKEEDKSKEEAWRLDPFTVTLPSTCVYGEQSQQAWGGYQRVLDAINQVLYDDLGFYGAPPEQFSQPEIHFFESVLRLKGGIPLNLGVIYIAVARRLGLNMVGVNLPSHFILYSADTNTYIDAYNSGKCMRPSEAIDFTLALLRLNSPSPMTPQPRLTQEDLQGLLAGTFGICTRMVRNLYAWNANEYGSTSPEAQRWLRQQAILQNW